HARCCHPATKVLDVRGNDDWGKFREPEPALLAPSTEGPHRDGVALPRVAVPDLRGEELNEFHARPLARLDNKRRQSCGIDCYDLPEIRNYCVFDVLLTAAFGSV